MGLEAWRRRRVPIAMVFDAVAWVGSLTLFTVVRFGVAGAPGQQADLFEVSVLAIVVHLGFGWAVRLHQGRADVGSFEESLLLGGVVLTTGLIVTLVNAATPEQWVPRTVPVAATFLALVIQAWGRAAWRQLRERPTLRRDRQAAVPTLIVGAGDAGRELLNSMLRDPDDHYRPIGFLDDDVRKRHRQLRGVPVLGTSRDMADVVDSVGAELVVLAMPSAGADVVREMNSRAQDIGVEMRVLPGVSELFEGTVGISDLRNVDVADLLGRHQIDTDIDSIAGYLTGMIVLVTGAGGSIGSELCRQIHRFGPEKLIMLDRDESALHGVQLSIEGRALLDSPDVVLGDIRDTQFLTHLFATRRPHVVFHAAALKHLPMLEQYPGEAVKTNIWGTRSVLEAANASGVDRFVNISTDKAANPCSVLGYSKRLAEGLTAAVAQEADGTYLSVRFGNVLGSRGSVLTTFAAQIAAGGPVTVTDPEVTRYFMTIEEACQLVIQAAAIGRDGEALVLDMGDPVRILDVAEQLIVLAGGDVSVEFTGLRHGEKLHEDLLGTEEPDERPVHPQVSHVKVPRVSEADVLALDPWLPPDQVASALAERCRRMTVRSVSEALR